jgi:antigen flippase
LTILLKLASKEPGPTSQPDSSYGQILKSSSIIGGAQGINYLIGMVRTKLVAVLLGPSGVGLVGLYNSAIGLVATVAGLGIGSSGVREVAEAHGSGDPKQVASIIKTLRRACWVTGFFGWALTVAFSYPLSLWTFGSGERSWAIALLGATLLIGPVSDGQRALLQGIRRVGDLARLNVLSVFMGTLVAVAIYAWLGEQGIVPVIITTAIFNLVGTWWFARKVSVVRISQTYAESWRNSKRLVGLGLSFVWSGLLLAITALAIRSLIARQLGLEANGIYQAAWGISGMFAAFILRAMSMDFYPRLTAVAHDNDQVNQLVNEQTEIGVLLAIPGLVATLVFAPWIMRVFYTAKFLPGADLLPWFVIGIFGKVVSWPMGFIQLAKASSRWFVATETVFAVVQLSLSVLLLRWVGLWGIALAFALAYAFYVLGMLWVAGNLSQFRWKAAVTRLLVMTLVLLSAGFFLETWVHGLPGLAIGGALCALSCVVTLRGIATRLGGQHRMVALACRFPGGRWVCGV